MRGEGERAIAIELNTCDFFDQALHLALGFDEDIEIREHRFSLKRDIEHTGSGHSVLWFDKVQPYRKSSGLQVRQTQVLEALCAGGTDPRPAFSSLRE